MMNLSLTRIREVFPYFNSEPITEADFWQACKREKITVRELPLTVDGYYQRKKGKHYILINSKLNGLRWLHTALHEFCHYLLHEPEIGDGQTLYRRGDETDAIERFADAFALIGILPLPALEDIAHEDVSDDLWLLNIVRDRIVVFVNYGI